MIPSFCLSEAEFKEFEPRLKFKPRLKYGLFHLKLYLIFQVLSRRQLKPVFARFKPQHKFIKFGHCRIIYSFFISIKREKFNQSECRVKPNRQSEAWKFRAKSMRKLWLVKTPQWYPKNTVTRKLIVPTLDIQIKRLGLRVSNSEVLAQGALEHS